MLNKMKACTYLLWVDLLCHVVLLSSIRTNAGMTVNIHNTPGVTRFKQLYIDKCINPCRNDDDDDDDDDDDNNNNSYAALYPVKIYKLAALYIINIKIRLTINNLFL